MNRHCLVAACVGLVMCPAAQGLATDSDSRQASLRPPRVSAGSTISSLGLSSGGWVLWASGSQARLEGQVDPEEAEADTLTLAAGQRLASKSLLGAGLVDDPFYTRGRYRFGPLDGKGNTPTVATSFTLNAARQIGALGIGGRIGYLDMRGQREWYLEAGSPNSGQLTDRTVALRQAFVGIDANYEFGRNWQLHGAAVYRRDAGRDDGRSGLPNGFGAPPLADRDEREWAVGLRYYGWRNFALNLEFLKTSGRDQFGNESLTFMGRFGF